MAATFAALGFAYAKPYANFTPSLCQPGFCKVYVGFHFVPCTKMEKYIQKPLGGAQAGFRLRQPYANLMPAHVFERAVSGLGFLGTGTREENFV